MKYADDAAQTNTPQLTNLKVCFFLNKPPPQLDSGCHGSRETEDEFILTALNGIRVRTFKALNELKDAIDER